MPIPEFIRATITGIALSLTAILGCAGVYEVRPRPHSNPASEVDGLTVAPEGTSAGYSREQFKHWVDADHDGCDTRAEILIAEEVNHRAQVHYPGCVIVAGDWLSLYDGRTWTDPTRLDVDHVVALKEAWQSGAAGWTVQQRQAFANELATADEAHTGQLQAVTDTVNSGKSDKDPAEWLPRGEDQCRYATEWVRIKQRWHLTADPAEVAALRKTLGGC